jgi:predicted transposase/invertase (TIGR01784 family)
MTINKFLSPKNDVAFKKIFAEERNQDILIHFINDVLESHSSIKVVDVSLSNTFQNPEIAKLKQTIVDVLCKTSSGEQIIIEMQVASFNGFTNRIQSYACRAYSSQLGKGKRRKKESDSILSYPVKACLFDRDL